MKEENYIAWSNARFAKDESIDEKELADEDYAPDLADEDYSVAKQVLNVTGGKFVSITIDDFEDKVAVAFGKRMKGVLTQEKILEALKSDVYVRCVRNKFKEVMKDDNNEKLSQAKVVRGHIASLMHCLYLVFAP